MVNDRKYIAVSIKHSEYSGYPVLLGRHRSKDNEKRCFSGYTDSIEKAELYSLDDFRQKYGDGAWNEKVAMTVIGNIYDSEVMK